MYSEEINMFENFDASVKETLFNLKSSSFTKPLNEEYISKKIITLNTFYIE